MCLLSSGVCQYQPVQFHHFRHRDMFTVIRCVSFNLSSSIMAKYFSNSQWHVYCYQVCVSFNPSSSMIATGSMDASCRLWDVEKGVEIVSLGVSTLYNQGEVRGQIQEFSFQWLSSWSSLLSLLLFSSACTGRRHGEIQLSVSSPCIFLSDSVSTASLLSQSQLHQSPVGQHYLFPPPMNEDEGMVFGRHHDHQHLNFLKTPLNKKYMPESEQRGAVLEKNKELLQDKQLPILLKKQVMDQCILPTMTCGC